MQRDRAVKNYAYRLHHDTGFAPHVAGEVCTLCGCKTTSIEVYAQPGSWIVGIGGNGTYKPDRLIYAMEVESNSAVAELRDRFPGVTDYLKGRKAKGRKISARTPILMSRRFYYFGDAAIRIPSGLQETLIIRTQGCKCIASKDIHRLVAHLERKYPIGEIGKPNNPALNVPAPCGCSPGVSKLGSSRVHRTGP